MLRIVEAGGGVAGLFAALAILRFALQAVVVIWSLRADRAGRTHALAVLRMLHIGLPSRPRRDESS
jgi:thioredoxin reductase